MTTPTPADVKAVAEAIEHAYVRYRVEPGLSCLLKDMCAVLAQAAIAAMPVEKQDERVGRFYRFKNSPTVIFRCIAPQGQEYGEFIGLDLFTRVPSNIAWSELVEVHKVTREVWEPVTK